MSAYYKYKETNCTAGFETDTKSILKLDFVYSLVVVTLVVAIILVICPKLTYTYKLKNTVIQKAI